MQVKQGIGNCFLYKSMLFFIDMSSTAADAAAFFLADVRLTKARFRRQIVQG
jgi:hypothetical protein